jgi:pimeloyl-ACP methyl ester carboxylesterase
MCSTWCASWASTGTCSSAIRLGKVAQLAASRNLEGLAGVVLIAPATPRPTVDTDAAHRHWHAYASRESLSDALECVLTYRPLAAGLREQVITDSDQRRPVVDTFETSWRESATDARSVEHPRARARSSAPSLV